MLTTTRRIRIQCSIFTSRSTTSLKPEFRKYLPE
jgi:hypothetical protein